MPSPAFIKVVILFLCTFLVLKVQSLYRISGLAEADFGLSVALSHWLVSYINTPITIGQAFVPSPDNNIIFEPPSTVGQSGSLGWGFPGSASEIGRNFFDGFSKNITILYTPPGGAERFLVGLTSGPAHGVCGFTPGSASRGFLNSFVAGIYTARWIVEFGQSSDADAPVDPRTGCGPEPFNLSTVEFVRSWEVLPKPES